MEVFNYRCKGASHKADGDKPCQDYTLAVSEKGLTITVVCDGHGGERYFRSDAGARIAAEVTEQSVRSFLKNVDQSVFAGKPFTAAGPGKHGKEDAAYDVFRQLFSNIIFKWNVGIAENAGTVKPSPWELSHIDKKYLDDLQSGDNLEKTYGCTLMAFVRTDSFWFAFHIGDGKCIAFSKDGSWSEPIPWDERCFLNKTTSMCDMDAVGNFRYCYQGDGQFPSAVFLGSDGIDDSFGQTENMIDFYINVLNEASVSREHAVWELHDALPELSERGSKDDMSVACAYEPDALPSLLPVLFRWQIQRTETEIADAEHRKRADQEKRDTLLDDLCTDIRKTILAWNGSDNKDLAATVCDYVRKEAIELQYAISDKQKAEELIKTLEQKKETLLKKKEEREVPELEGIRYNHSSYSQQQGWKTRLKKLLRKLFHRL